MDRVQPAAGLSDPYKNPELFRWLDSMEGVPDWLGPAETDAERESWSDWQRRGNHVFGLVGATMPGLLLAFLIAMAGRLLANLPNSAFGLETTPLSPILVAVLLGLFLRNAIGLPKVYEAGLQLALGADIRIAAPDTEMAVMEMKWGIVPDMGGMVLLPKLVRGDVLRLMTYTAQPIGAEQAERWGLITQIAEDPLAAAMALATTIAGKSPSAIKAAKRLTALAETGTETEVLRAESREQAALLGRPHQMEVIAAEFGKRPAVFKD